VSRRQRQVDELRHLCDSGALVRAVDLAFEHFAVFGCDPDILGRLADAIERCGSPEVVLRRLDELRARHP